MSTAIRFASALAIGGDTEACTDRVCREAGSALGTIADLAVLFVSHAHGPDFETLLRTVQKRLGPRLLIGCTGDSIVGVDREVEDEPAISLWLARLPDVTLEPMHLEFVRAPEGGTFTGWTDSLPEPWPADSTLLLIGEPYSFPADVLLSRLADDHPGVAVLGGMASGAAAVGENRVFLNGKAFDSGAVAVLVHGPVRVRSVVSQGCRPIGQPYVVTKADRNVILELGGRPALARLQETFDTLSVEDQALVHQGVHVGRVINEYQERFARGDFLVRNCIGADRETGALAIGDYLRVGQTVQFHVRDAASADEEMRELLGQLVPTDEKAVSGAGTNETRARDLAAIGVLMFTCNGRGTRLFTEENHDAAVVAATLGRVPLAGFFAQGEIGPVGGKNFLHGFTASIAVFEAAD